MNVLRADGTVVCWPWRLVREEQAPVQPGDVVPLRRFQALPTRAGIAVWLAPDDEPQALVGWFETVPLIAVDFPKFTDGRGYSLAALLRSRFAFRGELLACGDVLIDQLFYMKRVGFSAFALRADQDLQAARAALHAFTESYAGAVDPPLPHFRRHLMAGVS